MRILIDGVSLAGKSSLSHELSLALAAEGCEVEINRGPMVPGIFRPLLRWLEDEARPQDPLVSWLYCFLFFVEALGVRSRLRAGVILLQEGHLAQRIALAEALGHKEAARVMSYLKPRVMGFDLRIYLSASHLERVRRYLRRALNTQESRLVLTAPDRLLVADRRLATMGVGEHDCRFLTDEQGADLLAEQALQAIRRCSRERGLSPLNRPAFAA